MRAPLIIASIISILLLLVLTDWASLAQAADIEASSAVPEKTCADCPADKPCAYTIPSSCNQCSGQAHCVEGKWYSSGVSVCTLLHCGYSTEIPNPFDKAK